MAWYAVMGVLAAFGLLCAVWVIIGLFLPASGTVAVMCDGSERTLIRRYYWLRELGLTRCCLVLLDSKLSVHYQQRVMAACKDIEFLSLAQWCDRCGEARKELV